METSTKQISLEAYHCCETISSFIAYLERIKEVHGDLKIAACDDEDREYKITNDLFTIEFSNTKTLHFGGMKAYGVEYEREPDTSSQLMMTVCVPLHMATPDK